ncbi:sn-glycerol-3-phosphate ABC transporter ATP-binding protein UgpC [Nocardioides sp. InS609-2]|uniref:ABC transporter ATP-binding protein n=1 Tax=Nocardioides sp. InS609-2 TaxID=2760705 RepID=UPI0017E2F353|nr:sn-glycerol-3-phosphate ABC transporter ATP-binding protein UgpC [Nocardioides sp. InS609-2]MBA3781601.1 sn-glycerol-3-phosphate ABC transporter ATP-binding protein UgpC [Nocardioides sp.]
MATVSFKGATRFYPGSDRPAVDALDLDITDGEFLVLVGPSGCGKSTTLRMLAGLEGIDDGQVWIGDDNVTDLAPSKRDLAMVFQNYALYPHMTVGQNIGFHLQIAKMSKDEIERRVAAAAESLNLTPYLDRKPAKLSGGQRQRVAMGRAIVREPRVFLMDEPLSNLDAKLRVQTRSQIAALQRKLGVTTVYVTHDQVEAMTMGDRVAVLKDGVLQQVDTPDALFNQPTNIFVAGFIGSPGMNLFLSPVADGRAVVGGHSVPLTASQVAGTGPEVVVGVRPEGMLVSSGNDGIPCVVDVIEELGSDRYLYCSGDFTTVDPESGGPGPTVLTARVAGGPGPQVGDSIVLRPVDDKVHMFSTLTGERLG